MKHRQRGEWKFGLCILAEVFIVMVLVLPGAMSSADIPKASEYTTRMNKGTELGIVRRPNPTVTHNDKLLALPAADSTSCAVRQVDLRSADLSDLDVKGREKDLFMADFDTLTKWPSLSDVPSFNPVEIMDLGKNPGLGIRALSRRGITGEGVGIAVIDQVLLVDHEEYRDRLRFYEEIHCPTSDAIMHGAAVASIAVGRSVGIAPGADLYFIAEIHGRFTGEESFDYDWDPLSQSINRILEINHTLPKERKIRVISISAGWAKGQKNYDALVEAVGRAKAEGIFVVSSSITDTYPEFKPRFNGLGREPLEDPSRPSSYSPGIFWSAPGFCHPNAKGKLRDDLDRSCLLVPMDSRCYASHAGIHDYTFCRAGGWSWSIPYIAGLYALACQVAPDVTPERFWTAALETGRPLVVNRDGTEYDLGRIANPASLLARLETDHKGN